MFVDGKEVEESPDISGNGTFYTQKLEASDTSRTVDIPVFRFHGQNVLVNGEPAGSAMSERGTTELKLPASGETEIEISYKYTLLARAAWLFSMTVLISAIINSCRKRSHR